MLTCQYCNGVINPGQTECPHCGSSLVISSTITSTPRPELPSKIYSFSPIYNKGLAFWQNIMVMIFLGYLIACVYASLAFVPISFAVAKSGTRTIMLLLPIVFLVAYYLAVLTILAYYKTKAQSMQYIVFNDSILYSDKDVKHTYPIKDIENAAVSKTLRQAKYGVGTLDIYLKNEDPSMRKLIALNLKMKNIEQPDEICSKILELRDKQKHSRI